MIRGVRSNRASFREVTLEPGFNLIVADRTSESTRRDSRNGLGKSTLVDIIHYCLGSRLPKHLKKDELKDWEFIVDLKLSELELSVRRALTLRTRIYLSGDLDLLPVELEQDDRGLYMHVEEWKRVLRWFMFGLPFEYQYSKYRPTFRSLMSYFARRHNGGYSSPFKHHSRQYKWDRQVNTAFLLGLNWEYAREWQLLKDREAHLENLKKAAEAGELAGILGSRGELETSRVRLEERLEGQQRALREFEVHPEYETIEEEANQLRRRIQKLNDENLSARRLLRYYHEVLESEESPSVDAVREVYEATESELPDAALRRLEQVADFHEKIVANRRNFLRSEIKELEEEIESRETDVARLSSEKAQRLKVLEAHGALEEYHELQNRMSQTSNDLNAVLTQLENLRQFRQGKSEVRMKREKLRQRLTSDFEERAERWQEAIRLFNRFTESLYQVPGNLIIDVGDNGYEFDVEIERSGSQGVDSMKIFCYDLTLSDIWSQSEVSPGFLMHDSILWDGVDERQIASGFELVAERCETSGYQYITLLNTDAIPRSEFSEDFEVDDYVRLKLTDTDDAGRLLGIGF